MYFCKFLKKLWLFRRWILMNFLNHFCHMQPERKWKFQDFFKPTFLQLACSKVDTCPTLVFTRKDGIACYCKKHNNLTQFKSDSFELHEKKQINKPPKKRVIQGYFLWGAPNSSHWSHLWICSWTKLPQNAGKYIWHSLICYSELCKHALVGWH